MIRPPANTCIYCYSKPDGSNEHIVPEGLRGRVKIPNATCKNCKDIINTQFEQPFQKFFYKKTRVAYGYPSKNRRKKSRTENTLGDGNNWKVILLRKTVPFEKTVPITLHVNKPTLVQQLFLPPPFLQEKFPDIRMQPSIKINYPWKVSDVNAFIAKLRADDTDIVDIKTETPSFIKVLLPRLLAKIACGAFYSFLGMRCHEDFLALILQGGEEQNFKPYIRSADVEHFPMHDTEMRLFTVEENGKNHAYMAIRIFSEDVSEVYFVRVGAPATAKFDPISIDYSA